MTQVSRLHRVVSIGLFIAGLGVATSASAQAKPKPGSGLLAPDNHVMILIDHPPQMAFATKSIDIVELRNNVTGLAKAAKVFGVPTILTTVADRLELQRDWSRQGTYEAVTGIAKEHGGLGIIYAKEMFGAAEGH